MFKRRVLSGLAAICLASLATLGSAQADSGVALVIGNSAYKNAQPLSTVYADADATAQTLQSAGFDVSEYHDVAQADTGAVMRDFLTKVQTAGPDTVAFLYLSGYATQFNGDDYFVPSDAKIDKDTDIPGEALRVADVTDELAKLTTRAAVVVIDGSRSNSFGQAGGAPPAQGLAMVSAPQGMLIAYAAQPGAVAPDGEGPYSLFAGTLNTVMREPGHTLDEIFKIVRLNVAQATNEAQTPWSASALTNDVQLFEAPAAPASPAETAAAPQEPAPVATPQTPAAVTAPPPDPNALGSLGRDAALQTALAQDTLIYYQAFVEAFPKDPMTPQIWVLIESRREALLWDRALAVNSAHGYWNYLKRFPDGPHALEAQQRLEALQAATAPPPDYTPAPPPLPDGYVDEGQDVPEIVPDGDQPPPDVFGDLTSLFVPPPDFLPPPPFGFLPPILLPFLPPPQVVVINKIVIKTIKVLPPPPPPNTIGLNFKGKEKQGTLNNKPIASNVKPPIKTNIFKPTLTTIKGQKSQNPGVVVSTKTTNHGPLPPKVTPSPQPTPQPTPNKVVLPPTPQPTLPNKVVLPPTPQPTLPNKVVLPTPQPTPNKIVLPTPQPTLPNKVVLPPTPQPTLPNKVVLPTPQPTPNKLVPPTPQPTPNKLVLPPTPQPTPNKVVPPTPQPTPNKLIAPPTPQPTPNKIVPPTPNTEGQQQQLREQQEQQAAQKRAAEQAAQQRAAQEAAQQAAQRAAQQAAQQRAAQQAAQQAAQRAAQQAAQQRAAQQAAQQRAAQQAAQQRAAQQAAQQAAQRAAQQAAQQRAAQQAAQQRAQQQQQKRCVMRGNVKVCQ